MKVLYDYQKFSTQRAGGITRYFAELFSHFSDGVIPMVSLKYNRNLYISGKKELFLREVKDYDFHFKGQSIAVAFVDRINRMYSGYDLKHREFDVFHPTYYGCWFMESRPECPVVVTIHDMIQEIYPDDFSREVIADKKRQIYESDHIVAVSENTRSDILKIYPDIPASKISVIYHGASFGGVTPASCSWPDRYVLFVGRRDGYKNFLPFISAMKPLFDKDPLLKVVCVGEDFKPYERNALNESGLSGRVIRIRADDAQLLSLYINARAFVFPSKYEGFGLPILEAYRAGCPVCLAEASCFPEIAGDAALYFDPDNADSITDAVGRCVYDDVLRHRLAGKGKERLQMFDWNRSAASLENVYNSLV